MSLRSDKRLAARPATVSALLLLCAALHWGGCAHLWRPPPPPLPRQQVIEAVRTWADSIRTVRDSGISLAITETVDGKAHKLPTFGGHIGFDSRRPALYLLADKFGQPVFWLRASGTRFWLALPRSQQVATGGPSAYAKLPHLIRPDEVRSWFAGPEWLGLTRPSTDMSLERKCYRFDVFLGGTLHRRVSVDRRRLVITAIESYDVLQRQLTAVRFEKYAAAGGTQFPRRLTVERPPSGVRVELRLSRPQINPDINPRAFLPGEHPGWEHVDLDREPLSRLQPFGEQ